MSRSIQKTHVHNPNLHMWGVGVNLQKLQNFVFLELHEMSRTVYKTHLWQCQPHGAREGIDRPIHEKHLWWKFKECPELDKAHVFYSPTSQGGLDPVH